MAPKEPLAKEPDDLSDFMRPPKRADARRSYDRLLASASEQFAAHGVNAPLDDIARGAGVGNATLYRHFPTRQELIVAVNAPEFEALNTKGAQLTKTLPAGEAVEEWLRHLLTRIGSKQGLAADMLTGPQQDSSVVTSLFAYLEATAERLLGPARDTGVLRSDLRPSDLVKLITAVAFATEADTLEEVDRVFALVIDGLRPAPS